MSICYVDGGITEQFVEELYSGKLIQTHQNGLGIFCFTGSKDDALTEFKLSTNKVDTYHQLYEDTQKSRVEEGEQHSAHHLKTVDGVLVKMYDKEKRNLNRALIGGRIPYFFNCHRTE